MTPYVWLAFGLVLAGLAAYRAGPVWVDARQRGRPARQSLHWALRALVDPAGYWWGARLEVMALPEAVALLARETCALGLTRADTLLCPLCRAEVPGAWRPGAGHLLAVAPGPVHCPACDFRLDACRHCARFLPGRPAGWTSPIWEVGDITFGRCEHYKSAQPIEVACAPDMARQLRARGYTEIRGPYPIADSMLPPDFCRAFRAEPRRLRAGGIPWPGRKQAGLVRLLVGIEADAVAPRRSP